MAKLKLWNGSAWVDIVASVWDGSAWQDKLNLFDGNAWIPTYGYGQLTVNVAPTRLIYNGEVGATDAIVRVHQDGGLYASDDQGNFTSSYEIWLDEGENTQVWIERTINSGTLTYDAGSGRLAMTSSRDFGVRRIAPDGMKTAQVTIDFYDAASGGTLLDSQVVTLQAENFDPGGIGCPTCCFTPDTLITIE